MQLLHSLQPQHIKLDDIIEKFMQYQEVKGFSDANKRHYRKTFSAFLKAVPIRYLDEYNAESINDFIYKRSGTIKNVTIVSYLKDLRAFHHWLVKRKFKDKDIDWHDEIDQPIVTQEEVKYISKEDLVIFHNHVMMNKRFATEFEMYLYQAIFMTYMWCGTRFNETRKILRNNVDFENRIIWLDAHDNKSKRKDKVPIHSNLFPILKKYIKCRDSLGCESKYLFFYTRPDVPISESTLRRWLRNIKMAMKAKHKITSPINFHAMRHSLGHISIQDGVPLPVVQKLLRHTTPDITIRFYTHPRDKELLEGIDRYDPLNRSQL